MLVTSTSFDDFSGPLESQTKVSFFLSLLSTGRLVYDDDCGHEIETHHWSTQTLSLVQASVQAVIVKGTTALQSLQIPDRARGQVTWRSQRSLTRYPAHHYASVPSRLCCSEQAPEVKLSVKNLWETHSRAALGISPATRILF